MYFTTALPAPPRSPPAPPPAGVCWSYHLLRSPVPRPPPRKGRDAGRADKKKPRSKFKFRPPEIVLPRRDHLLAGGSARLVEQVRGVLVHRPICTGIAAGLEAQSLARKTRTRR